jgi:hypothetical protein
MATNAIRAAAADIDEAAKTDPASRLADPRV